ncbi:hypothetical protein [Chromobacterium violaceum]|uniref:hypothetical protein n=1 Tax=Chromobacterium violaceum TaxID=536 RepID=UPI000A46DCD6|nr:hypothetical protein [Chromobacterium violaceum]
MDNDQDRLLREITKEGNFWQLFRMAFSVDFTLANKLIPIFTFVVVFLVNIPVKGQGLSFDDVASSVKDFIGWNFTILGFMIAGYAIFTTVTSADLSLALMKKCERVTGLPYLKYIHAVFLKAILVFLLANVPPLLCSEFIKKVGLVNMLFSDLGEWQGYCFAFFHAVNVSLFILALAMLKSYIFNIYASVMMAVRWSARN